MPLVSIRLDDGTIEDMDDVAAIRVMKGEKGITRSDVIRDAVVKYLDEQEVKYAEALKVLSAFREDLET